MATGGAGGPDEAGTETEIRENGAGYVEPFHFQTF